jgi:hypothetical protein
MPGFRIEGNTSGNVAEVNDANQIKVVPETDASTNPGNVGGVRAFGENDQGLITGITSLASPEIDVDYRMRVAQDTMLDEEVFSYTAQNTGKHNLSSTTMAASFTAGQYTSNSASITTIATGTQLATYAYFPNIGANTLAADYELAFSAQPTTNSFIEFGLGLPGGATAAPTDGVFFRLNSAGLQGIASNNGTETSTGVFPLAAGSGVWAYINNKRYQFIVYMGAVEAEFWVNDGTGAVKLGQIPLPAGQARMCMAQGMQVFHKHRIVGGAAGGVLQSFLGAYSVRLGGANISTLASTLGNRMYGSYQGLSGGTMGSLANYANSANPTAAVPTNTTAALGVGLGGQFWETDTLAVTTDGIIQSYQVPQGTANVQGRRLVIRGVKIQTYVQTALTGGGYVAQWSLAFGHTAVSLATAEGVTSKAPRRIPLGIHGVPSAAAVNSTLGDIIVDFGDAPVFVNPGEFVQVVKKKVGTAPTAGTLAYTITYLYGWE